jgi:hypothetical protein
MSPLGHTATSMAICLLYGPMSPLQPYATSTALCHLNGSLFPLWPSASLQPFVLFSALHIRYSPFPLHDPLPLRPSVLSTALCLLYSSLSPLWPSVCSTAICPIYVPLKNGKISETTPLVSGNVCKSRFVKTPRILALYFV